MGQRLEQKVIESVYDDLGSLSRGLDDATQGVQRLIGKLRELDDPGASAVADVLAVTAEQIGDQLAYVAVMQARIRDYGFERSNL
jgi:hypothetical protein